MASKSKMEVITSITDSAALQEITTRKVLLAGESVFVSLNPTVPPGFVQQQARDAVSGLFAQFSKNVPKVFVAVDERLVDLSKLRFALAFDGYLSWGLRERRKGSTILFGGGESETGVNVEIMVFADNRLIELHEKSLPESSSTYFRDAVQAMIAELRMAFPTARFVQAAPLADWGMEGVEYIDDKPLRSLSYRPLTRTVTNRATYVIPAALAALGLLAYSAAVMTGWNTYSTAVADYELAVADPAIKSKGGMDTDFLSIMNNRRMYMEQPRRQTALADKSSSIVRGIAAVPNVRIVELKLPAPNLNPQAQVGITISPDADKARNQITSDRSPDVWISIAVPKSGEPAIVQAKTVMIQVANSTGMSLRLAHQGWRDDQARRIFNIEGFIHD